MLTGVSHAQIFSQGVRRLPRQFGAGEAFILMCNTVLHTVERLSPSSTTRP